MLAVLLPLLVLGSLLALAFVLDVRRGARMPLAAAGAVGGLVVGSLAIAALRSLVLRAPLAPAPHVLAACGLAAAVGAAALLARLLPPRFPFTLAALAPLAALLFLRTEAYAAVVAVGGALAAALWPWALAHGFRGGAADKGIASAAAFALVLATPPALLVSLMDATDGNASAPAEHAWTLHVRPDGEGAYVLRAPFFLAMDARAAPVLEDLRRALRVVEGDGEARLVENGTVVEVRARGDVRVEARVAFFGPASAREAFHGYRHAAAPLLLSGDAPAAEVTWSVDFSGGRGHTCWTRGDRTVALVVDEPTPLPNMGLQGVCA